MRRQLVLIATASVLAGSTPSLRAVAQTLCDNPQEQCSRLVQPDCLQRLGAGTISAKTPAMCTAQLEVYKGCLSLVAQNCIGKGGASKKTTFTAPPNFEPSARIRDVQFQSLGCSDEGETMNCRFRIKQKENSDRLSIGVKSTAFNQSGKQLRLVAGLDQTSANNGWFHMNLYENVLVETSFVFKKTRPDINAITTIRFWAALGDHDRDGYFERGWIPVTKIPQ